MNKNKTRSKKIEMTNIESNDTHPRLMKLVGLLTNGVTSSFSHSVGQSVRDKLLHLKCWPAVVQPRISIDLEQELTLCFICSSSCPLCYVTWRPLREQRESGQGRSRGFKCNPLALVVSP